MRILTSRSRLNVISRFAICFNIFMISGCASTEKLAEQPPEEIKVNSICILIQKEDWVAVGRNFKKVRESVLDSDMDRKFFISAKLGQLEKVSRAVSNGDNSRVSQLKNFCKGLDLGKPLVELAEAIKSEVVNYSPIPSEESTASAHGPSDYLRPLNEKFPHWTRDTSGPLTGTRSDFGILDVLYNANSKCSLWIFSSFDNFVRFNNAWGNTFAFNYPSDDRFGNTYVTENSIYSTTCSLEYSEVFG